jgi:hypothetical protein
MIVNFFLIFLGNGSTSNPVLGLATHIHLPLLYVLPVCVAVWAVFVPSTAK